MSTTDANRTSQAESARYIAQVADGIREGQTVHREVLLHAAQLINPRIAPRERTAILERTVLFHDETGQVYRGRD